MVLYICLFSQWLQHSKLNSKILIVQISSNTFPSLNWVVKLSLNWGSVTYENHEVMHHQKNFFEHTILSVDSCRFCVSLITTYSYRWYPFFLVILSQISCFFCNQWKWLKSEIRKNFLHLDLMTRLSYRILQLEG